MVVRKEINCGRSWGGGSIRARLGNGPYSAQNDEELVFGAYALEHHMKLPFLKCGDGGENAKIQRHHLVIARRC